MGRAHALAYRATRGLLGGRLGRYPFLLLTSKGRRSGKPVHVPLLYIVDGSSWVIVASSGGSPRHPAWYFNLGAEPRCVVRVGRRKVEAMAETVGPEDRDRLWTKAVELYAPYAEYQERAGRVIPLVHLARYVRSP